MKASRRIVIGFISFLLIGLFFVQSGGKTAVERGQRSPDGEDRGRRVSLQSIEGPFVSDIVVPSTTVAVRDLPPYQPEDPTLDREVNPRFNFNPLFDPTFRSEGGIDPLLGQQESAPAFMAPPTLLQNFDGNVTGTSPHDPVGDVGPTYYIQGTNAFGGSLINIIDKVTRVSVSTFTLDSLGSNECANGLGDPIILWDDLAQRWFLSEFSSSGNRLCVYISQTSDPLGSYHDYNFTAANSFPDYPKYGVWPDAYYLGTNESTATVYAMDRANMLTGAAATYQSFNVPDLAGFGFQMLTPSDHDGATLPPTGAPNYFMRHRDDEVHNAGSNDPNEDYLEIYEFDVDWGTPANSSFTKVIDLPVAEFDSDLCGLSSFNCFPQQGSATTLDPLREVIMWRLQYRNFGSHETLMATHVTDVNGSDRGGVRWYELRKVGVGAWRVHQQGTYSPDAVNRFMSSIGMDQDGNVALAYSVTSSSMFPSLRYTGREVGDPLGTMSASEVTIHNGTGTSGSNRWGDYSSLNLDPVDDCTFWYTMEYGAGGTRRTRIASFKFDGCGGSVVPDFTLTATPTNQSVCVPNDAVYDVAVTAVNGLAGDINLAASGNPGTAVFTTNPVALEGNTNLTISGATAGNYAFDVIGTHAVTTSLVHTDSVNLMVATVPASAPTLASPTDGATGVALLPTFAWGAVAGATGYIIEIADDAGFSNIVDSASVVTSSYTASGALSSNTMYYWRVRANNGCGSSSNSTTFSFTTTAVTSSLSCNGNVVDFESGIPNDWSIVTVNGTGWGTTDDGVCGSGNVGFGNFAGAGEAACIDSDAFGGLVETYLCTPALDLTSVVTADLDFLVNYQIYLSPGADDFFQLLVSPTSPNGPYDLALFNQNNDYPNSAAFAVANSGSVEGISLDAYAGQSIYACFRYGGDFDWYAHVDDVQLSCSVPQVSPQIVVSPASLTSTQASDTQITDTLTISNVGTADLTWSLAEDNSKTTPDTFGQLPPSAQFLTSATVGQPLDIALDYVRAERGRLGLNVADIEDMLVRDQFVTAHNGTTHLYLRQRFNGIEVYGGDINVNVARDGGIINLHNDFVPNLATEINAETARLTAVAAVEAAAAQLGLAIAEPLVIVADLGGDERGVVLNDGGISLQPIPAKLVYQPVRDGVRLAWDMEIEAINQQDYWSVRVDALTGEIVDRLNLVIHEDFIAQATEAHGVAPNVAQTPVVVMTSGPTHTAPVGTNQAAVAPDDYRVFTMPVESPLHNPQGPAGPPDEGRTLESNPATATASPFGWHDTDGSAGAEYTITRGNNVHAYENGNNVGFSPDCGGSIICDFNLDLSLSADTYEAAVITNLFHWNNLTHDVWYEYGFDEASGNMQENNYGNGGAGSDYVNAQAQDGAGTCNANMTIVADGTNPRMRMYLCGSRDGSFDNGVIVHEYWHSVSTRLTGGPSSPGCLSNSEQGGEGWSDYGGLVMTIESGDLGTDSRGMGTYLIGEPANGPGIRPQPYSTDMGVNDFTYADVASQAVPHGVGWGWATILWDMTWALVDNGVSQSGLDLDFYNGTGGNNLAMQLVIDGLKLQSCNPSFIDARDAILLADQNNNGGVNQCVIWDAFARRGLGVNATDGGNGLGGEVEDFNLPAICLQTLKLTKSATPSLVAAGGTLTYTLVARNDTVASLTGVTISDTIQTNQTYVNGSASCGGSESGGVVSFPLGTLNSGQGMTCTFQVSVAAGLSSISYFSDDFEDGSLTNWTVGGLWNVETESDSCGSSATPFPSSDTAAYYGIDNSCDYDTGAQTSGSLTMLNSVSLPANSAPALSFNHYKVTEPTAGYDFAYVEISANGGGWVELTQLPDSGWQANNIDLSAYAGDDVQIRFRFDSSDGIANGYFGVMIDDVAIVDIATVDNRACVTANEGDNVCDSVNTMIMAAPPACMSASDIPWLTPSLTNGTVTPNSANLLDMVFDSNGLGNGIYSAHLCLSSNDGDNSEIVVPVTMHVCTTPTAVTDLTLVVNGSQADLQWSDTGADSYEVWWGVDTPYFMPGTDCGSANNCVVTTNANYTHNNAIGNLTNYTFAVVATNSCANGSVSTDMSNRYGEFDFSIKPGG